MNGYLAAHGDTMTVDLVVSNERPLYAERQRIVSAVQWDGQSWCGVDGAAEAYRRMVGGLDRRTYIDMAGVDIDKVDFHRLICAALGEVNLRNNRAYEAGM
jgi:hypothetical protein